MPSLITIDNLLTNQFPGIHLGVFNCQVSVKPSEDNIRTYSESIVSKIQAELTIESVSQKSTIKATKEAYRKLGKDPSRYRPSAEALTRRVINGKGLYWINNIVDLLNLISLDSGFSIGGYDTDKITGNIEFGVGLPDEPYEAIGRGSLNIENLPLFRDSFGAFGSPTSDSVRTMVTEKTTNFLMIIIDFIGHESLKTTMDSCGRLYSELANVQNIKTEIVSA